MFQGTTIMFYLLFWGGEGLKSYCGLCIFVFHVNEKYTKINIFTKNKNILEIFKRTFSL